jgi:uncharacterized membrane protein
LTQITDSIEIGCSPGKVYTYIARVEKWPTWFVALGTVRKAEGDGAPGTRVEQTHSLLGLDIEFVTTVMCSGPKGDGAYEWRATRTGDLPGSHSLDFAAQDGKTLVTSTMEYELPGGVFGKAVDHLGAKAAIEHWVRHSLAALKELAEEDWIIGMDDGEEQWPRVCHS